MEYKTEDIAKQLFEIASEQRLEILFRLNERKSSVSKIAKDLDATVPEVFRNFERLKKASLIEKYSDGNYATTLYGKTVCTQIPSFILLNQHKKYFQNHSLGNIPRKFIQRIGALESAKHVNGVVRVLEKWKHVHQNAQKYIYNILSEVPYSQDIIETVQQKAKSGVNIQTIFSDSVIVPEERKTLFDKLSFKKFIDQGILQRKMLKNQTLILLLNEEEACILFPKTNDESDMSEMLYSSDPSFHDWCLDYFKYCWERADIFQESKLLQ